MLDRRIHLIGLGAFAVSTIAFLFAGLLPLIAADTGISVTQAGYLASIYSVSYAVSTPVISALAGGFNRRHVVVAAMAVFSAGAVLTATSQAMGQLIVAQVITGMAAGQFAATGQAIAVSLAREEVRARAISIVVGGTSFAVALGAPFGSFLAHYAGWRAGFLAIAGVALACTGALWVLLPANLPGARLSLRERIGVVRRPRVARLILTTFVYLSGGFAIVSYFGPLALDGAGMPAEQLPLVLLIYGVGAICGNMLSGRITDRVGPRRVVTISLATGIVASFAIIAILEFLPRGENALPLVVLLFLWGVVGWVYPPAQTSRLVAAAPQVAHLALALNASAIYLGIAFGTFVGGRILEAGPVSALGLAGAGFAGMALALVLLERRGTGETVAAQAAG